MSTIKPWPTIIGKKFDKMKANIKYFDILECFDLSNEKNHIFFFSKQTTFTSCATGTTENNANSAVSSSTSNLTDATANSITKSLIQYDSNGGTEASAINYDGMQTNTGKYEHELSAINNGNGFTSYPLQPKHIRFPDVPYNSQLVNELMIFLYTMIATAMQFLHLYRTVWWLPDSNTNQTMNFYLIDGHLTVFIVILIGRRFMYCFLLCLLELICPKRIYHVALKILR